MALKFSEMIALRTDLALSLEAGFDNYLEEVAGGYGDYLAPVLDEGEPAIDARFQMVLLRRSVERHRNRLDNLDEGVIGQSHDDEKVRAEINQQRDAVDNKLRLVRSTCRGIFGPESLARVGLKGIFPRGPARLLRFGLVVRASLENPDLGLEPLLDLDAGADEATPSASVRLAAQLDPELSRLGELVNRRHQQRRRTVAIRLGRQEVIREFDSNIRGIVRMAQGMFRLAGRNDLGLRFRPILQRALRRLKSEEGESGASQTSGEVEGSEVEPGAAEPTAAEPTAAGAEPTETTA